MDWTFCSSGLVLLCWSLLQILWSSECEAAGYTAMSDTSRLRRLTAEEQLIIDLFKGYDTDARAVINTRNSVTVKIEFLLLRLQKLDERSQILSTTGLLLTDWTDERLSWVPKLYSNISDIVVSAKRIWLPELAVINGADEMMQDFQKIRVLVHHDGGVHWEPGGVFVTTCDIDISYYPFDIQSCPIEIGAWAYKISRMNLTSVKPVVEMGQFNLNGEWEIFSTSAEWKEVTLPCCPDIRYSKVLFTLHMRRRQAFYVMNIILPCTLLSVLVLVVFCVPPGAGEKISAGISVLLAFTVFLLMLADNVPRTSLAIPVLVQYLTSTMALGTFSVCMTVVVLHIHHKDPHYPVPNWARVLFLKHCARALCMNDVFRSPSVVQGGVSRSPSVVQSAMCRNVRVNGTLEERVPIKRSFRPDPDIPFDTTAYRPMPRLTRAHTSKDSSQDSNSSSSDVNEWQLLAKVIDRIMFVVVFLSMTLSASFILLSPWYSRRYADVYNN